MVIIAADDEAVMVDEPIEIGFHNTRYPNVNFDIIRLEDLFQRKDLDHEVNQVHRVQFYLILLVEAGKGSHSIDFKEYGCSKGTLLTIRKDQIQQFSVNDLMRGKLLLFLDDFLVSYLADMEGQKTMLLFNELLGDPCLQLSDHDFQEIVQLFERINTEYQNISDDYSLGIIRSELHILISKLFRIKSQRQRAVFDQKTLKDFLAFQALVEARALQTTKVLYYAQELGVSAKTLSNITKRFVHKTAKQFVDEICIKQIKRLLINTELSVKEVAYRSGFEETTNFYKFFKRHTATTPERFRSNF